MLALILLLLVVVPVVEIYVIVAVGQQIGAWPTIALILLEGVLGAWLVRREARRTWAGLQAALRSGRVPDRELGDGGLVLVGATLLLTPGFVTDVVGLLMVLPPTRTLLRRLLISWLTARALRAAGVVRVQHRPEGPVIRGEVIDPPPPPQDRPR